MFYISWLREREPSKYNKKYKFRSFFLCFTNAKRISNCTWIFNIMCLDVEKELSFYNLILLKRAKKMKLSTQFIIWTQFIEKIKYIQTEFLSATLYSECVRFITLIWIKETKIIYYYYHRIWSGGGCNNGASIIIYVYSVVVSFLLDSRCEINSKK
jgi:hypothetical protein